MRPTTATGRINEKALELLEKFPEGIRWTDLAAKIYTPTKGLFRLVKYKSIE